MHRRGGWHGTGRDARRKAGRMARDAATKRGHATAKVTQQMSRKDATARKKRKPVQPPLA